MKTYIQSLKKREEVRDAPSHLRPIVKKVKPRRSSCRRPKETIDASTYDPKGVCGG